MASFSDFLHLHKPDPEDFYDISLINQNTDKLDLGISSLNSTVSQNKAELDSKISSNKTEIQQNYSTLTSKIDLTQSNLDFQVLQMNAAKQNKTTARNKLVKADSAGQLVPAIPNTDFLDKGRDVLEGGTIIPHYSDLNTFVTPGIYLCSNFIGIINCPFNAPFKLFVQYKSGDHLHLDQICYGAGLRSVHRRCGVTHPTSGVTSWSVWHTDLCCVQETLRDGDITKTHRPNSYTIYLAKATPGVDYSKTKSGLWTPALLFSDGSSSFYPSCDSSSVGSYKAIDDFIICTFSLDITNLPLSEYPLIALGGLPFCMNTQKPRSGVISDHSGFSSSTFNQGNPDLSFRFDSSPYPLLSLKGQPLSRCSTFSLEDRVILHGTLQYEKIT